MNLMMSSTLMWGSSLEQMMETVLQFGLSGLELRSEQVTYSRFSRKDVLAAKKAYGLPLSLHAPSWDLNSSSLNEAIREKSIHEIKHAILFASAIGASPVIIHPGRTSTVNDTIYPTHQSLLRKSIEEIDHFATCCHVHVAIELMGHGKKELVFTPKQMNTLLADCSPFIHTTFNVAHTPIGIPPANYSCQLDRLSHYHLSDSSSSAYHIALGEGEIELGSMFDLLNKSAYPIVLEGFEMGGQMRMLKKHLHYLDTHTGSALLLESRLRA